MNHSKSMLNYRGLVLREIGQDPQPTDIRLESKIGPNQVLVKMLVAGICGKQLEEISGASGFDRYLPHLLGHEGSGIVVEVGESVSHVSPDDLVVLHWITEFEAEGFKLPLFIDSKKSERINAGPITTFSEYTVVSSNRVTAVPKSVDPRVAALLGCGLSTGLGAVFNEAKINQGDRVLVVGCGGVGLSVIQGCHIISPELIAAIDMSESALLQAELCGAKQLMHIKSDACVEKLDLTPFSHILYCIGSVSLLPRLHERLSSPSRLYLVGVPGPDDKVLINARHIHQRKSLHGSYGGMTRPSVDFPLYLDMIKKKLLDPYLLLGDTFSLDQSVGAFKEARSGSGKRIQFAL